MQLNLWLIWWLHTPITDCLLLFDLLWLDTWLQLLFELYQLLLLVVCAHIIHSFNCCVLSNIWIIILLGPKLIIWSRFSVTSSSSFSTTIAFFWWWSSHMCVWRHKMPTSQHASQVLVIEHALLIIAGISLVIGFQFLFRALPFIYLMFKLRYLLIVASLGHFMAPTHPHPYGWQVSGVNYLVN